MDNIVLNAAALASYCKVAGSTVTAWLDRGLPTKRRKGASGQTVEIELRAAVRWLARHRAETPAAQRWQLARAEKAEMQNANARSEMLPWIEVVHVFENAITTMYQGLGTLPKRFASDEKMLIAMEGEIFQIKQAFADRLEALLSPAGKKKLAAQVAAAAEKIKARGSR